METKDIYDQVNRWYGSITKSSTGHYEQTVAKAFGYTEEDLAGVPERANLGLSCGNPIALARLREGETVIDLGSGAGFDVFAAAKRVGLTGKAIRVDMNKNMVEKANTIKAHAKAPNVQFMESAVTSIALPDNTADCIISNCVINLVPAAEKQLAFDEMFRLLKPGGRVAISDILGRREFTEEMKKNIALYVGCVAGASQVSEYDTFLKNAGFDDVLIVDSKNDMNVYFTAAEAKPSCCGTDTAKEEETSPTCCHAKARGSGCQPEERESCCGADSSIRASQNQTESMAHEAKTLATQLGITDFNEWAGEYTGRLD
ncbi:Arsenite methyltransferase [Colletotrichum orbiculare MAFF 240422]|uniref:Arsenite methyltransferase n=1 Tax=Colletotrichum orbiculare (strain 104-T / ATCC 96160 / CBS 514.97 / LARS 414 / MAFF 240422) TaxID=1213857 RepID=N4VR44_COLOR|nr:Arsenite methyltransferase [Colletotrichum orbiculare MAFF 240422]